VASIRNLSVEDDMPTLKVYNGDADSFHVNAVLVTGKNDAVLIDTGFTLWTAARH
jgi:hypothetical protein